MSDEGLTSNACMLCGSDSELTRTNSLGEDQFKCSAGDCQVEFKETNTVPALLPSSFEEDVEYVFYCGNGTRFRFIVRKVADRELDIEVFDGGGSILISSIFVTMVWESEFFIVPRSISGTGERVFPYCRKS